VYMHSVQYSSEIRSIGHSLHTAQFAAFFAQFTVFLRIIQLTIHNAQFIVHLPYSSLCTEETGHSVPIVHFTVYICKE
jgi:hypothetical protein